MLPKGKYLNSNEELLIALEADLAKQSAIIESIKAKNGFHLALVHKIKQNEGIKNVSKPNLSEQNA